MSRSLLKSLLVAAVAASAVTLNVLPASAAPVGFTIDQESDQLASIDAGTATVTDIGGTNDNIDSLALACGGVLYATASHPIIVEGATAAVADSDQLVTINTTTGASTVIGDLGLTEREYGLAFAPDGTLYLTNHDQLFTVNKATGATTLVGSSGDDEMDMRSLAFNAAGTLYGYDDNTRRLYTINSATGATTPVGTSVAAFENVSGLDFDSAGTLWAIASGDGSVMATFDLTTGELMRNTTLVDARGLALTALCPPTPPTTTTTTSTTSTTAPTTTTTTAKPTAVAVAVVAQPHFAG